MADYDFIEAQRVRFYNEKAKIADRLRNLADAVDRIRTEDHRGKDRQPVAVVGEVTHTVLWGVANLRLDLLASQAEDLYDLRAYDAGGELPEGTSRVVCPYKAEDMECILTSGHQVPIDEGIAVHVTAEGMQFL